MNRAEVSHEVDRVHRMLCRFDGRAGIVLRAVEAGLAFGLGALLVSLAIVVVIGETTTSLLVVCATAAALLVGILFWWAFGAASPGVTVLRGLEVGALVGMFSYPVMWLLVYVLGALQTDATLGQAVDLRFELDAWLILWTFSLLLTGLVTVPTAGLVGMVVAYIQGERREDATRSRGISAPTV